MKTNDNSAGRHNAPKGREKTNKLGVENRLEESPEGLNKQLNTKQSRKPGEERTGGRDLGRK